MAKSFRELKDSLEVYFFNSQFDMMKTAEDMTVLGPVIEKQQKIINDCVDKKLQLGKLQSGLWEKTQNTSDNFTLTEMDDDLLQSLIMKDVEKGSNDSVKYNL